MISSPRLIPDRSERGGFIDLPPHLMFSLTLEA